RQAEAREAGEPQGYPQMISLTAVRSAAAAGSYYAADNYYSVGELTDGSLWMGEGARTLWLEGRVQTAAFAEVLAGRLPDGSVLDARRGEHRPGLDMTFSAPKLLSLLASSPRRAVAAYASSCRRPARERKGHDLAHPALRSG
ncbi:MAG: relaxase domain-containing protein, partial [Sphingomonadaceae bacterium]